MADYCLSRAQKEFGEARMAIAKWGVIYNADALPLEDVLQFAFQAESAGADVVWTAEGWRDAFVPLAAIASVAKKLRVGTAIAQMARPPVLTTLGALSMAEGQIHPRCWNSTKDMERKLA
jgi:hypothetical protein